MENTPQLMGLFFNKNEKSAKDFLLYSLVNDNESLLTRKVRMIPAWKLEPLVIWVLSKHFNVFALEQKSVRLATLIQDLDTEIGIYLQEQGAELPKKVLKNAGKSNDLKEDKQELPDTGLNPEPVDETSEDGQSKVEGDSYY